MVIQVEDFYSFLYKCLDKTFHNIDQVVIPAPSRNPLFKNYYFTPLTQSGEYNLDSYRTVDPLKIFFFQPREKMLPVELPPIKRLIVGAKGCDLRAMYILDQAMINKDFVDPGYNHWRQNTIIISSDCAEIAPTCHCTLVGGKPFAESGFDLNLSRLGEQYRVTVGSDKGQELLNLMTKNFPMQPATEGIKSAIEKKRNEIIRLLHEQNRAYERSGNYERLQNSDKENWNRESLACVGCGACTHICPTCYCLILNDETKAQQFVKVRSMDSCQLHGYARVAGGGSPRPKMYQRFRNRYLCKFLFMHSNFGELGCTGCGRCTETCTAGIDFRKVVHNISETEAVIL